MDNFEKEPTVNSADTLWGLAKEIYQLHRTDPDLARKKIKESPQVLVPVAVTMVEGYSGKSLDSKTLSGVMYLADLISPMFEEGVKPDT